MNWQMHIHSDPEILAGKPVIKGTRLAVEFILGLLANGWTEHEVLESYPALAPESLRAIFAFTAEALSGGVAAPANTVHEPASSYAGKFPGRRTVEVDAEEYEDLRYRLDLLQGTLNGMSDAEAGRTVPHDAAMAELLGRYAG